MCFFRPASVPLPSLWHTHTATIVKQQDESGHDFNDYKKKKKGKQHFMLATAVAIFSIMFRRVKVSEMMH